MNYDVVEVIAKSSGEQKLSCVVPATASLAEVASMVDLDRVPYVLVEDASSQLIGIMDSEMIRKHLSVENEVERRRWSQMDVESALQWKIFPGDTHCADLIKQDSQRSQCTAVSSGQGVMALVSDDDVYVSWHLIRDSLTRSMIDAVSALPNRMVFERRLGEEIERSRREKHSIATVLFDIDYFKQINDNYGHAVGDTAILAIGQQLKNLLRSYDVLARYGGDEFAAICCACEEGEIDIPLRRIQNQLAERISRMSISLPPVTLSIGAAVVHDLAPNLTAEEMMNLADECLYRSKEHGRNCAFKVEVKDLSKKGEPTFVGRPEPLDQSNQTANSSVATPAPILSPPPSASPSPAPGS